MPELRSDNGLQLALGEGSRLGAREGFAVGGKNAEFRAGRRTFGTKNAEFEART